MKKIIPCVILLSFISLLSPAQTLSAVDTNKYSIHLPDYWRAGNKIWQILSDKLPLVCEELRDKELCGDNCNPKYSIEFEMSEPEIEDYHSNHVSSGSAMQTWEFVTLYRFTSALLLLNDKNELLTKFILVDTNELWRVTHKAELASYRPSIPQRIYLTVPSVNAQSQTTEQIRQQAMRTGTAGESPFAYISKNKDKLWPTQRDMLGIIDEKIRSW